MPKKSIIVATENKKAIEFMAGFLSDTQSIPTAIRAKSDVSILYEASPDVILIQADWVDSRMADNLSKLKTRLPKLRCFHLGHPVPEKIQWDGGFDYPLEEKSFRRTFLAKVDLPECIKLLVVDDDPEIGEMFRDYFEVRTHPSFQIQTAANGLDGFKLIEQDAPHCLILDLKMPVRSGVELYQDLARSNRKIPTVVFIDSTTADDILEIRKWGAPVFIEKGGHYSSMPDMLALIKKLIAFS